MAEELDPDKAMTEMITFSDELLTFLVLDTLRKLKKRSPVDTGSFRANWNLTEGRPDVNFDPKKRRGGNKVRFRIKTGGVYYITNNAPYARRLADGYSPQAPAGWVRLIHDQAPRSLNRIIRKISKR